MKPTQLNKEQINALLNGASMLVMSIPENLQELKPTIRQIKSFISMFSPLQMGEEYFVQEEFMYSEVVNIIRYRIDADNNLRDDLTYEELMDYKTINWKDASQMQEHQSRLKFKCIEIEVKRVQDINVNNIPYIQTKMWAFDKWLEKQGINYKENPYIFLAKVEVIK